MNLVQLCVLQYSPTFQPSGQLRSKNWMQVRDKEPWQSQVVVMLIIITYVKPISQFSSAESGVARSKFYSVIWGVNVFVVIWNMFKPNHLSSINSRTLLRNGKCTEGCQNFLCMLCRRSLIFKSLYTGLIKYHGVCNQTICQKLFDRVVMVVSNHWLVLSVIYTLSSHSPQRWSPHVKRRVVLCKYGFLWLPWSSWPLEACRHTNVRSIGSYNNVLGCEIAVIQIPIKIYHEIQTRSSITRCTTTNAKWLRSMLKGLRNSTL